ncbi:CRISPR-associated protein, Csh2 family [Thermobaculum terrenum ATCC BAA-798]|uniref:CRISPR-associated protein, Csh2 family n=2 Tax=Thermobaculum TaxID=262406 RepID=D1CHV0_THET1|nr:type I-B CRISPR-associated protein Cas7/Csh2 [Thermobaculum terrenum]ACZ43321.1 CRISPR-associated protein, Csh2 family [Thermobaculum terrenum ATCC BAA-798]
MPILDSDILYLYDAKLTNPNGDPDDENRPRMDSVTGRNLVSDVRLKRYLRDYWLDDGQDIWVRKNEDGTTTDAKSRMSVLLEEYNRTSGQKLSTKEARNSGEFRSWLLDRLMDVRLFGATMPMENSSITFTGPVQFSWGYSLHRVEINNSATISSHFAGRDTEGKGDYGTFGKDWRVLYSLIGFHGIVSRNRARHTGLRESDLEALDRAMLEAIPTEATSRSKIGQIPRFYLRLEYSEGYPYRVGDLREDVVLEPVQGKTLDTLRDVRDYVINLEKVADRIAVRLDGLAGARLYVHPDVTFRGLDSLTGVLGDKLQTLS